MALYSEKVMDHFRNPRNVGVIENADGIGGLPAHKIHCSVLAEEAIKKALQDYYEKNGIDYDKLLLPNCERCSHCPVEQQS